MNPFCLATQGGALGWWILAPMGRARGVPEAQPFVHYGCNLAAQGGLLHSRPLKQSFGALVARIFTGRGSSTAA